MTIKNLAITVTLILLANCPAAVAGKKKSIWLKAQIIKADKIVSQSGGGGGRAVKETINTAGLFGGHIKASFMFRSMHRNEVGDLHILGDVQVRRHQRLTTQDIASTTRANANESSRMHSLKTEQLRQEGLRRHYDDNHGHHDSHHYYHHNDTTDRIRREDIKNLKKQRRAIKSDIRQREARRAQQHGDAMRAAKEHYERVDLDILVPAAEVSLVDIAKLATAKRVKAVISVADFTIREPMDTPVAGQGFIIAPSVVGEIKARLVVIEKRLLRTPDEPQAAATTSP